jgi:hypothetical protein
MAQFVRANLLVAEGAAVPFPPPLATALASASRTLHSPDDFPQQHGAVASGWEVYYSAGESVVWKSGGTIGYGSFMAWNAATQQAAVALGNCGNCGVKAVDQLVRQLADPPPVQGYPPVVPAPTEAELAKLAGCFLLPAMTNHNREPARPASQITLALVENGKTNTLRLSLGDGGGSAILVPYAATNSGGSVGGFFFPSGTDSLCIRPDGCGPLEEEDRKSGRREAYFTAAGTGTEGLALHVSGWDLFAPRMPCSEDLEEPFHATKTGDATTSAAAASRVTTNECGKHTTCEECLMEGEHQFCGWCSPGGIFYANGTRGLRCGDERDDPWDCPENYQTKQTKQCAGQYTCNATSGQCLLAKPGAPGAKNQSAVA